MQLSEVAERLILLQRLSDRTGNRTGAQQAKLARNLTPDEMVEVARLVLAQIGMPALYGPEAVPELLKDSRVLLEAAAK